MERDKTKKIFKYLFKKMTSKIKSIIILINFKTNIINPKL